jgi:hypothetical protein
MRGKIRASRLGVVTPVDETVTTASIALAGRCAASSAASVTRSNSSDAP